MRNDMFKVIVERPRWGSRSAKSPKLRAKSHEKGFTDFTHLGMQRHIALTNSMSKSLNENLAPLRRFLQKQRGRRWDDVFSEICAQLDTSSTVKMHVRLHLEDFVATRITCGRRGEWMFDGRPLVGPHRFPWSRSRKFFVDPRDGILKDIADLPTALAKGEQP